MAARDVLRAARSFLRSTAIIGGQEISAVGGSGLTVRNPANFGETAASANCSSVDVDRAVRSSQDALSEWSHWRPTARANLLRRVCEELEGRRARLAGLESWNTGKPLREANGDVDECINAFRHCADLAEREESTGEQWQPVPSQTMWGRIRREPLGVIGAICPWNYPAMMASWKVAPALAAGCTVVAKPSELTPFTTLELADACLAAGVPRGVFNVIPGGREAGAALASHPGVDKLTFTGSVPTGRTVMRTAAERIIPVTLELGGKSPAVVFADADLEATVEWLLFGLFWNAGQICSATTRILVDASIATDLTNRLVRATEGLQVGGPDEFEAQGGPDMGPVISQAQVDKFERSIADAVSDGAQVLCGGHRCPQRGDRGFFVQPTLLAGVGPSGHRIWNTEVFAPVGSITTFRSFDEAINLANQSEFGLAAAVFGQDERVIRRASALLQAGTVWENCNQPTPAQMPWGGTKRSGLGREMGPNALDPFLQVKAVHTSLKPASRLGWFSTMRH